MKLNKKTDPPAEISAHALGLARKPGELKPYPRPIQAPVLFPGVVPKGRKAPVLAEDNGSYTYAQSCYGINDFLTGFPGYPYLAQLTTRAEYRLFASALSTELTREWITLTSSETAGDETKDKINKLNQEIKRYKLQDRIRTAAEHDSYFGRGQIFIEIDGHDPELPLVLDARTIKKGSLKRISNVEPMWTTPSAYNALDPTAPDFYKPTKWFVMGKQVHASRLLSIVSRPLPDMLKPAFNFSGMSLSQLTEPYVDNWLRTRQSVSDLINNFSITALATSMDQVLTGQADGTDLFRRVELFTATRSNRGMMLLDKEREQLVQVNTPLSGLSELQSQAEEHMGMPSQMPMIVLTGISPAGLNASSEGELLAWENRVAAAQEADYREPIEIIINAIQLSMFGTIDEDIHVAFNPLRQMTPKELAEIRIANSTTAANYLDRQVISPDEERERLARDPESGYQGLDLNVTPTDPNEGEDNEEVPE
jgi:hypothetical protein